LADNEQAAAPAAATNPADQPPPSAPTPEQAAPVEGQEAAPAPEPEDDEDAPVDISKPLTKSQLRRLQRQNREREITAENARLREVVQAIEPPPRTLSLEERIGAPPNPQSYQNNPAAYWAAKAAYDVHRQVAEKQIAAERTVAQARETAKYQALARTYEERQIKARSRLPDYDKVVGAAAARMYATGTTVSQPLIDAIVTSDLSPEIEYHLALNPAKLHALNQMRPEQVAREIGRLEAVLQATPPARTSTQAPPPPSALKGGSAGPARSLADMSMDEYVAARKAGRRA